MTSPVQYCYSLKFSVGTIVLMTLFMLLLLNNVIKANSPVTWSLFGIGVLLFISLVALLIAKRLIPAIKGDIALELDDEGINDYIRDVSIGWNDIKEIALVRGRSASTMRVDLKWESDYGSEIAIPLRWVKGKDDEIYKTTLTYFSHFTQHGDEESLSDIQVE